jgi:BirA family transcriptional regulator, biotin operon repressor / biotin---[acetyl-CoA-carboxylase] ligase
MPFKGEKIIYYATCSSTNSVAMNLVSTSPVPEGTIVITDCQVQGRGQRGNTWISEPYQNLTFSLILYPSWLGVEDSFQLNMVTTLGIYHTLTTCITQGLSIKWPNDIYFQDQKVGGILIESIVSKDKLRVAVVGIGLNVNQTNFNNFAHATSLSLICGYKFNLSSLLLQLTNNIQRQYDRLHQDGKNDLQKDYLQYLYGLHEIKTFRDQEGIFQGMIEGVDEQGRLVIDRAPQERRHYNNQEIALIL